MSEVNNPKNSVELTKFSTLRGWGCKIPQDVLNKLLERVYQTSNLSQTSSNSIGKNLIKVWNIYCSN